MGFGINNPRIKASVKKNPQTAAQMGAAPVRFPRDTAGSAKKPPMKRPDMRGK